MIRRPPRSTRTDTLFPTRRSSDLIPTLTEKNKVDLTRCAEAILLAREAHFPSTIADLYAPEKMPTDLREAHERNDEVLERSEEHTSELQSLMRISYAVFCLIKKQET